MMSVNLEEKQQLLDKIQSLSEDKVSSVLSFIESLSSLKDAPLMEMQETSLTGEVAQEVNLNVVTKIWQPCNDYDAIAKLTCLLEADKLDNEKF